MRTKVFISIMSLIAMLGFGVQPSLADPERGYSHAYSSEHGCCAERMGHMGDMGHMGHKRLDAHSGDHLRHLLKHQKEIGLTEEQVKKLKTIELDFDRARIKSEAEIHVAERELLALVEDEKTDLSAIEAKVKQSGMLEVGLRMLAFKARHDALGVLTPEQREKGKAAHENRMRGMSGMSGMHEMMSGQQGGSPGRGH